MKPGRTICVPPYFAQYQPLSTQAASLFRTRSSVVLHSSEHSAARRRTNCDDRHAPRLSIQPDLTSLLVGSSASHSSLCSSNLLSNSKMQHVWIGLLLLLFLPCLTSADLEKVDRTLVEVLVDSSPCSTTCGMGFKTQTLCVLEDGETSKDGTEKVLEDCRVRTVKCLQSWQCGLRTMTVTSGERVELDCLGEAMEAMGRFSWRVTWGYAGGIITTDDSLFIRRDAPLLDRVILDSIREEDAGTYRCVVQEVTSRIVKRAYWGIRVLPVGILAQWNSTGNQQNETASDQPHPDMELHYWWLFIMTLVFFGVGFLLDYSCREKQSCSCVVLDISSSCASYGCFS